MADYADLIPAAKAGGVDNYADLIPATPAPVPEVDLTKPAFGTMAKPFRKDEVAKKVQAEAEAERNKPKFSYDELYSNPELFKVITDYSKVAMGSTYKEGTDKKEFVNSFMANMRGEEWNTFSNVAALNKLRNSSLPDKEKLALGNRLFEEVASAGGKGGQPGAGPYVDIAKAALTDLTNYIGFGVGTGLKKAAAKEATKAVTKAAIGEAGEAAVKSKIASLLTPAGITAATTATEAGLAVGQNVIEQKKKQEVAVAMREKPKDLDPVQMGVAALFGGVGGFIEGRTALSVTGGKSGAEQFSEKLMTAKVPKDPNAPVTEFERMIADPVAQNMDDLVSQFNKQEGRRIVDDINPLTAVTDAKIQSDLSARAVRVAMHVIEADPTFRLKPNQKTSDALANVFSNLDTIDDAVLEQAIRKEGLSPEQFAQANLMTVSDAARVMQQYSAASKILTRMTQIDPEVGKLVDSLFNKPDEQVSALGRIGQVVRTVERESKAFVVSGIGTTVRNILGTTVGLTYNSAASLLEGAMYTVGRTLDGAASGKRVETALSSLGDTFRDAFSVYGYMAKNGLSTEVTNSLLQHNPALRNNLLSATQESSTKELSKAAQVFNTLNVAQDSFFRKAIFNASVEKSMRRAGMDMYQVIGEGKAIPASILQKATDDTLKATFSYTPKAQKKGIETFESGAEAAGNLFVKAAEFPGGSLLVTFPRFMSNAIAFQYRYSVFGAASGAEDLYRGAIMKASGSSAGDGLIRQGQENIAKGVVGTAALAAAYDYRLNNQDTDWFNMKKDDGGTADMRSIFPIGPTLAVADFLAKRKLGLEPKTAEMVEAIVGMKMPSGTQSQLLDQVFAAFSSEKDADKLEIAIGKVLGDFTARFSQPFAFKSAYEFLDLFREGGAIQRDPNVISGDKTVMGIPVPEMVEAGVQRVQSKLPILKESLPEAIPRLRDGPVYKEGEFFYSLIGVRETPAKTPAESEVTRLGIDPYRLYGPSSGDKLYDRAFVTEANPLVIQTIQRVMADDRYKQLSPTEQRVALGKSVSEMVDIARDITDAKFTSENLLRVKKMQFNKLTSDERKIINERYAKDNGGVTLEEAKDFTEVDAYKAMLGTLRFAAGGMASKLVGKAASNIPVEGFLSKLRTINAPVDSSVIDNIVNKNLPAVDQTTAAIPTVKKAAAKKTVAAAEPAPVSEVPAAAVPEAPVARQMEEAMPTPIEAVPEAPTPMPNLIEDLQPPALKRVDEYDIPEDSIKFTDNNTADDFTDIDYNEDPTNNLFKDYSDYTEDILSKDNDVVGKTIDSFKGRKKLDDAIATVRKEREDAYSKISGSPDFLDFDPIVVSTALAKTREKVSDRLMTARNIPANKRSPFFAPEFDIENASAKEVDDFFKLASTEQKKLDQLRARFETRPPVSLIHGQEEGTDTVTKLAKKGFMAPQGRAGKHAELNVGAPSFTKDPNINALIPKFGGADVKAYGSVNIPYGDYIYRRINMPARVYDEANPYGGQRPESALFTYNRAITGAPDDAVPISLPKGYHLESEDIFLEADKLKAMGFSRPSGRGGDKEALFRIQTAIGSKDSTLENLSTISDTYAGILAKKDEKRLPSEVQVYSLYKDIRNLFKNEIGKSESVGVTGGAGSRYVNTIRGLATAGKDLTMVVDGTKYPITDALKTLESELNRLATRKNNTVLTEKADNIRQLRVSLENISKQTEGTPSAETISATSFRQGSKTDKIDGLKAEMSKLDQKISKEWDVDVIDDLKLDKEMLQDRIDVLKKAIVPSERTSKDKIMKLTDKLAKGGLATRR